MSLDDGCMPYFTDRQWLTSRLPIIEGLLSVTSVCLVLLLPLHYVGSHLCAFGTCATPGPEEIRTYRVIVAALAGAVVVAFALAVRRRARRALAWHTAVALTAVASALMFTMPAVDWREVLRDEPPSRNPGYVPCHSGGPNDCPGGG